ncbi:HNH endonuclease [Pseudarthrobacter sp. NIBRBAC000502771]|uniref:HNH endonuclease n=1 Tax=Pseudarthrobacter sp. NIBRBAC000502771 TaxID=2590774 RepID=UPI00143CF130|nr:HNH endonuclease [Pseudarthrobacter sp. NIBRBAC000502771]
MAVWIIASDYATYRSLDAFRALEEVNWSEAPNAHIAPGDVVYLYITRPISAIGVKCYVTSVGLPELEIDDREFWVDEQRLLERINGRTWMRLKRVAVFSDEQRALLKGAVLERYGLRGGFVQSRQRATVELLDYIESVEQGRMIVGDDAVAEAADFDPDQVAQFKGQIARDDYAVPDQTANAKTRGSAQRAFADTVKSNYNGQCAITGISTREFLVASHIVPWSEAPDVRLDPRNGICLSTLVDRAFDAGFLQIGTDYVVRIDWTKIVGDAVLGGALKPFDGRRLTTPERHAPHPEYLRRRLQSSPAQAL